MLGLLSVCALYRRGELGQGETPVVGFPRVSGRLLTMTFTTPAIVPEQLMAV